MILKGSERGGPTQLAAHLINKRDNDHVELHDLRGFVANDLFGAFQEIHAVSLGTKCRKFMFSLSLNPPGDEDVPVDAFEQAIQEIESKLGLTGLPRAIVFHEKQGPQGYRRHAHCVWSRIDGDRMRAVNISHYKRKLTEISRSLYLQHGWQMPTGLERKESATPLNYTHSEHQQAKRANRDAKELKRIFIECWERSDSKTAFASALKEHGLILAKGDRRGHVVVDGNGEVYAVSRWVGIKAKEVRAILGAPNDLPSVVEAQDQVTAVAHPPDNEIRNDIKQDRAVVQKHAKLTAKLEELQDKRQLTIAEQRQTRIELKELHHTRHIAETTARSGKLSKGLKAVWSRLSGNYQELISNIETEAEQCQRRDSAEWQKLIDAQVQENRELQKQISSIRNQLHQMPADTGLARSFELNLDPTQTLIIPADPEALTVKTKVQNDPVHVLSVLTNTKEFFSRNDIVRKLSDYIDDPIMLGPAVNVVMRSDELCEIEDAGTPDDSLNGKLHASKLRNSRTYSTREFQKLKAEFIDEVLSLSKAKGTFVSEQNINSAIASENRKLQKDIGASLSQQQEAAIRRCLGSERLVPIIGYAGAGKSTMLSAARHAWERQGYSVIGAALSGKAADGLEKSSDIESHTIASLEKSWNSGYKRLTPDDVLVIDEAGMIGTRQMARVIKKVQSSGAKLVLVGDPEQLQPIGAGTPFRDTCKALNPARLTEIHRQQEDWQKQASLDLAQLNAEKALQAYKSHGHVVETPNTEAAILSLVEDYMADLELHGKTKSRLALAHRRKDVHTINQAIRSAIKSGGGLAEEVLITSDYGKRAFAKGDRIIFTKNDRSLGVRNGMLGTVQSINQDEVAILPDEGSVSSGKSRLIIDPKLHSAIEHGYATTIHKSQGVTVDHAYVLGSKTMDKHVTYVAMTRHRDNVRFHTCRDDLQYTNHDNELGKSSLSRKGHTQRHFIE